MTVKRRSLRTVPLHSSLTRPILLGGAERDLVIIEVSVIAALLFGVGFRFASLEPGAAARHGRSPDPGLDRPPGPAGDARLRPSPALPAVLPGDGGGRRADLRACLSSGGTRDDPARASAEAAGSRRPPELGRPGRRGDRRQQGRLVPRRLELHRSRPRRRHGRGAGASLAALQPGAPAARRRVAPERRRHPAAEPRLPAAGSLPGPGLGASRRGAPRAVRVGPPQLRDDLHPLRFVAAARRAPVEPCALVHQRRGPQGSGLAGPGRHLRRPAGGHRGSPLGVAGAHPPHAPRRC